MTDILVIVAIALCAVILIVLIILLVRSFTVSKKQENESSSFDNAKELGASNQKLDSISGNLDKSVELSVSRNVSALKDDFRAESEKTNKSLNEFKETVTASVNNSVTSLNKDVTDRLIEINKTVGESINNGFKGNSETMENVSQKLGQIEEAQRNLESLQGQVTRLNTTLSGNQTRGAYGEMQLEIVLENTFPNGKGKYYYIQDDLGSIYEGENKARPDADIVFNVNGNQQKLCIDSKFPFSNYQRLINGEDLTEADRTALKKAFKSDVEKRIQEVASKYIIPGKTTDYAILFIPNDGVFAYVENEFPDTVTKAREKKVIIACPSTLQAIVYLFHSMAIDQERNENVYKIEEALKGLSEDFRRLGERWGNVSKNIRSASDSAGKLDITFRKLTKTFDNIKNSQFTQEEEDESEEDRLPENEFPVLD